MNTKKPGFALATVLILLGVMLFGVGAIISISSLESKISRSQQEGTRAYYVAEAGMEDALWKINNTSTYSDALAAGTLTSTYSVADKPEIGQGYSVTYLATSPGYGRITVAGYSTNNSFTARRQVKSEIFQGGATSPTGNSSFLSGGSVNINNGSSAISLDNSDFYVGESLSLNNTNINLGTGHFKVGGNYNRNGGNVSYGGIEASNYPPAPVYQAIPGIDFNFYDANNNASYSPNGFKNAIKNGGSTVNFPGPVTYISGDLIINNWAKNKTINITGMLVVDGNLTVNGAASGATINIIDPGNGKSGIFVRSNLINNEGNWNVDGVLFASGSITFNNSKNVTIHGGMIAGGSVNLNTGLQMNLYYDSARIGSVFGSGEPLTVGLSHWEEDY